MNNNYFNVTERPGHNATKDQLSMMLTRYNLARAYAENKKVLEIACGAGMGLGYLAERATNVVGGDIDPKLVEIASEIYKEDSKVTVEEIDAHKLPYKDSSFDLILMYESVYYLSDIDKFISEVKRTLTPNGQLIISTVNREWHGFNPSPHSIKYYSLKELNELMTKHNFTTVNKKGFFDEPAGSNALTSTIRKIAVSLNLIPKTMAGKERLKRLFYGKLTPIPEVIHDGLAPIEALTETTIRDDMTNYKFIYTISTKK